MIETNLGKDYPQVKDMRQSLTEILRDAYKRGLRLAGVDTEIQ